MIRKRQIGSVKIQLITQAQEAALCAIKVFNDPLVKFKSEDFIVLMVIAWTYLLHAYYRSKGINYRYYQWRNKRRVYDKTKSGAKKHWELEKCLNDSNCPIDKTIKQNLRFLIGLRHEIEHHLASPIDNYLSGRYQACAMNFNYYVKKLFGARYGLDNYLVYSIQFMQFEEWQLKHSISRDKLSPAILKYIDQFDKNLTAEELNSPFFSYSLLFIKRLVNRAGQADKVVEFIDPKSDLAREISKEYWVKKEVERPKYRAKDIVTEINKTGFSRFRINPEHIRTWKSEDAKNPAKGYGVEVGGFWYWYKTWLDRCLELCKASGEKYR
jgi:hypothetical protein